MLSSTKVYLCGVEWFSVVTILYRIATGVRTISQATKLNHKKSFHTTRFPMLPSAEALFVAFFRPGVRYTVAYKWRRRWKNCGGQGALNL